MIDESINVGSIKHLALITRFQDKDNKTVDQFLCLLPILDGTAKFIFKEIVDFFIKNDIALNENH